MSSMQPRPLVVFDLGGVVVRICRSLQEACAAAGVEHHVEMHDERLTRERRALVRQFEIGAISADEFFEGVAKTSEGRYTREQFQAIHEAWILEEYPGVGTLIDDLHSRGVATGVLSNTNASHWRQLVHHAEIAGHRARFETPGKARHVHASHLLKLAKPDQAIYHEFARRTGFAPADIVFFDDLAENVEAARRAGWTAHQVDHTGDTARQMRGILAPLLD